MEALLCNFFRNSSFYGQKMESLCAFFTFSHFYPIMQVAFNNKTKVHKTTLFKISKDTFIDKCYNTLIYTFILWLYKEVLFLSYFI